MLVLFLLVVLHMVEDEFNNILSCEWWYWWWFRLWRSLQLIFAFSSCISDLTGVLVMLVVHDLINVVVYTSNHIWSFYFVCCKVDIWQMSHSLFHKGYYSYYPGNQCHVVCSSSLVGWAQCLKDHCSLKLSNEYIKICRGNIMLLWTIVFISLLREWIWYQKRRVNF